MNRDDSFDQVLEGWLRREAPLQAPDRVLDAALQRVSAASQRRGWAQRLLGGKPLASVARLALVAAAVAVAAFVGLRLGTTDDVGPSPSPAPSATPTPGPTAALPSTEPSAVAFLVRLWDGGESGWVHLVTVLDDGRLITSDPFDRAPMERRLTEAGIQLIRDEMDATGLTDTSAMYMPVANPGVDPPGFGGAGPRLEIAQPGGDTVAINWYLFGDTEEDWYQPQPEAEVLQALLARLSTLEEWLPAEAWADANAVPYLPESYRMTISFSPWGGSLADLPPDMGTVSWPLGDAIGAFGEVTNPPPDEVRCGVVDAEDGGAVIAALEAAGAATSDLDYQSFGLGDRSQRRVITITLVPILPFDESSC
jgi:hypothetical protein